MIRRRVWTFSWLPLSAPSSVSPSPPLPSALLSFSLLSPFPPLPVLVSSEDEDLSLCGAFWGKVPDDNGVVLELVPPGVVSVSLNPLPQRLLWGLA